MLLNTTTKEDRIIDHLVLKADKDGIYIREFNTLLDIIERLDGLVTEKESEIRKLKETKTNA